MLSFSLTLETMALAWPPSRKSRFCVRIPIHVMVSFILRWTGLIFGFVRLPSIGSSWPSPKASWRLGGNSVWHLPKIVAIALPRKPFCAQFLEDRGQRAASKTFRAPFLEDRGHRSASEAILCSISRGSWPSRRQLGEGVPNSPPRTSPPTT